MGFRKSGSPLFLFSDVFAHAKVKLLRSDVFAYAKVKLSLP